MPDCSAVISSRKWMREQFLPPPDLESPLRTAKSPGKVTLEGIKKGKPTTIVIDLPS
jgi:hypothetical protein